MSWNLGVSTCRKPQGLPRPVIGLLYYYYYYITTTTTTTTVERELHKLLPCCTICNAAPRRSDVTNRSTTFGRLLLYKENEWSTNGKNDKRQKTHRQNRRGLRKITWHRATQHTLCQLTQLICIHLHPLRLVTTNSITVLWYRRLFSFSHDSSRTSWVLSRQTPPPSPT
jgi:hypothetical protein